MNTPTFRAAVFIAIMVAASAARAELSEEELAKIVEIQIGRLGKRLAQQNLTLDVDAAAKKLLAREGYDPQFGARPLKRAVQEQLLNPLSMKLLEGEFKPGDRIKVTANSEGLVFKVK